MNFSPAQRAEELNRKLLALAGRRPLQALFLPSLESDGLQYFPDEIAADFAAVGNDRLRLAYRRPEAAPDVVLTLVHGRNGAAALWRLREQFPEAVLGAWLWDNHLGADRNLAAVLGADVFFPSHHFIGGYLANPLSLHAGHTALCCAQWSAVHARRAIELGGRPRGSRAYAGYVDYPGSDRGRLLAAAREQIPEIDVITMQRDDRSRYFAKSSLARLDEWLGYPVSVVLPINCDLSTRFFDGLLAGHVPVVSDDIADLDAVVPPSDQASLPVVKFRAGDIGDLRSAVQRALRLFAEGGPEGVRRRQTFAGGKHLAVHRILKMIRVLRLVGDGKLRPVVHQDPESGPGLFLQP